MVNIPADAALAIPAASEQRDFPTTSSRGEPGMREDLYECQLSAVCHCGGAKLIGAYLCADCWQAVPDEVRARVTWLESLKAELRTLVGQIEQIARLRNPERLRIFTGNAAGSENVETNAATSSREQGALDRRGRLREHFRRLRFQMTLIEERSAGGTD
ncbi:MAG: hypothetical protein JWR69_3339 [Pedosphaera sp.]|nr:hypothetical protein [Pedosphaera sp.]